MNLYTRLACILWLSAISQLSFAQACMIETGQEQTKVIVCQENKSIPAQLFVDGFCQPQLAGQKTSVTMLEKCPDNAFGVCQNAQTAGAQIPYQQDIYYYGQSSDARFLEPACQQYNNGTWKSLKKPKH